MSEHYFTEDPTSEIREKTFSQTISGAALTLVSVSGVFSFEDKVDKASELLIKAFLPSGDSVLDLGCGYGAVGLFIKALHGSQNVWLTDINTRAVEYAKTNANRNSLNVTAVKGNLYTGVDNLSFDDIVTNPPIAAGKDLNTRLIEEAYDHLNPGGSLWLVAFHNKGGSTLKKIMQLRFGNAEDMEKSGGIRVYRSIKQSI